MRCPHCKKPIPWKKSDKLKRKVKDLHLKGFSLRDIAGLLEHQVSFSTIGRWVR